jgi:hypothetical protein
MAQDIAAVIDEARRRAFVGRGVELAGFDDALTAGSTRRVLFVHGSGGIGKTALLHQFARRFPLGARPGGGQGRRRAGSGAVGRWL